MNGPFGATRERRCCRSRVRVPRVLLAAVVLLSSIATRSAHAQGEPVVTAVASVATGLEGANPGLGSVQWQRARTRLLLGGEWRGSESEREAWGLFGLFELEQSGSFGAELRYRRWTEYGLGGFVGPLAILQPESLYGVHGGLSYHLHLKKRIGLMLDGGFAAFPIGSDRPTPDAVVMWWTLGLGLAVGF